MRAVRDLVTLDAVEVGDHVCWVPADALDAKAQARAFVADGELFGDKVVILGASTRFSDLSGAVVIDPQRLRGSLLGAVHRQAVEASAQGFRALRVLARMDRVWPDGTTPGAVAEHEMGLDALTAATGSIVACCYRRRRFTDDCLIQALSVHPHHVGTSTTVEAYFRMYQAETEHWHVSGVVDADSADAFRTALTTAAAQCPGILRLHCETLDFMDAAAMQILIHTARNLGGRRIELAGVNDTVRDVWNLLGYGHPDIPVELVR